MLRRGAIRLRPLACLVLAGALAPGVGCGEAREPESTHEFTVTQEDGVTIARTTGGPKYEGELFVYEKVMEILPDPDRPETLFFRVGGRALDPDGNLYVVDSNANRISVFDAGGNWVRDIGRAGEGPGEFQFPNGIEHVGGLVRVPDMRRRGTHIFRADGEFVEFEHWPDFQRIGSLVPEVRPTPTGGSVVRLLNESRDDDQRRERAEMAVFDEEGTEIARVSSPWVAAGETVWREVGGQRRGTMVFRHFAGQPWGGYEPGMGIWLTTGEEPTIWWYDLDGQPKSRWEFDFPPVPVTDADRAAVEANLKEALQAAINPPDGRERPSADMARIRADKILIAEHKPYWGTPRVDDRGFMWVTESPAPRSSTEPRAETLVFLIFSPEGEYLGRTTPPRPGTVSRGHLLTSDVDRATEEMFPVVYQIRPAVEGLSYRSR